MSLQANVLNFMIFRMHLCVSLNKIYHDSGRHVGQRMGHKKSPPKGGPKNEPVDDLIKYNLVIA
ncbi:hypothetical protein PEPS_41700 (plasmid) [Persicobacter psychrovividus]|uniref:Uncharacterized protein n=1 Tax=Persicobacter psychrovividus TaxID=387638 RepID=A0ABN6LFD6_9BACT|nr:hypothetical protein PEPS_41700 [Persicobacter psychrovividus]